MGAISTASLIKKPVVAKKLVCRKNKKLLKSYGIVKSDIVELEGSLLVKYHDETAGINRYVKLSRKLMKCFKEVV